MSATRRGIVSSLGVERLYRKKIYILYLKISTLTTFQILLPIQLTNREIRDINCQLVNKNINLLIYLYVCESIDLMTIVVNSWSVAISP